MRSMLCGGSWRMTCRLSPQKSRFPQLRRFSAAQILDLEIRVLLPEKLTGEHRLDVSLYTPDHQLYQTLTVPFRGPGTRATLSQLEEEAHRPSTADRRGRGSSYPRGQAPPHGSQRGPAGGGHLHRHQLSLRGVDGDGVSGRKPEVLRRRSAVHDHRIAVARLPRITFPGSSALSPLSKTTTPFTSTASNPSAYWWGSANVARSLTLAESKTTTSAKNPSASRPLRARPNRSAGRLVIFRMASSRGMIFSSRTYFPSTLAKVP